MVGNGACANWRSFAVPLGGCRERWCDFFAGPLCEGRLQMVGEMELALIYVRSVCRWAVAANACVSCLLARCARGGCKGSETELALIYVRSLCRWAVAANARVSFLVGSLCYGRLQRVGNGACANLRLLAVPLGGCRERLCEIWLAVL